MSRIRFFILALIVLAGGCAGSCSVAERVQARTLADGYKGVTKGRMRFEWKIEGDKLRGRLSARTRGWVSVGFDASSAMKNANIVIGYVQGGQVAIRDDFGTGMFSHKADETLGGRNDLSDTSGTEKDGITTLLFTMPLDSGDASDRPLVAGKSTRILLACGADTADDFTSHHDEAETLEVNL